jgi:hypothetical protein
MQSKNELLPQEEEESKKRTNYEKAAPKKKTKKRHTLQELEEKIITSETRIQEITEELGKESTYQNPTKVKELKREYDEISTQLQDWNQKWNEYAQS